MFELHSSTRRQAHYVTLSLLCVLLIAFAGFVQSTHVHNDQPNSPSHECSVCSVVHAGVLPYSTTLPIPVIFESAHVVREEASPKLFAFASYHFSRPPPAS